MERESYTVLQSPLSLVSKVSYHWVALVPWLDVVAVPQMSFQYLRSYRGLGTSSAYAPSKRVSAIQDTNKVTISVYEKMAVWQPHTAVTYVSVSGKASHHRHCSFTNRFLDVLYLLTQPIEWSRITEYIRYERYMNSNFCSGIFSPPSNGSK